jgi:hypothetical protein
MELFRGGARRGIARHAAGGPKAMAREFMRVGYSEIHNRSSRCRVHFQVKPGFQRDQSPRGLSAMEWSCSAPLGFVYSIWRK